MTISLDVAFYNILKLGSYLNDKEDIDVSYWQLEGDKKLVAQWSLAGSMRSFVNRLPRYFSTLKSLSAVPGPGVGGGVKVFAMLVGTPICSEIEYSDWLKDEVEKVICMSVDFFCKSLKSISLQVDYISSSKLLGGHYWEILSGGKNNGSDEERMPLWKRVQSFIGCETVVCDDEQFLKKSFVKIQQVTAELKTDSLQHIMKVASRKFNFKEQDIKELQYNFNDFIKLYSDKEKIFKNMDVNIPAQAIVNVIKGKSIDADVELIKFFVNSYNSKNCFSCDQIFQLVNWAAEYWSRIYSGDNFSGLDFARVLRRMGMTAFAGISDEHNSKVRSIQSGDVFDEYVLGAERGSYFLTKGYREFEIVGDAKNIIRFYGNNPLEAEFRIGSEVADWLKNFLPNIKYLKGHIIAIEGLRHLASEVEWTTKDSNLIDVDYRCLEAISKFVRACIEHGAMPKNICESGYLLVSDKRMKFKDIDLEPFDFIKMESILWKFSHDNPHIFYQLMEASGMREDPYSKIIIDLYKTAFQAAVENIRFDALESMAINYGIEDENMAQKIERFYCEVTALKNELKSAIVSKYDYSEDSSEDDLKLGMLRFYKKFGAVSVIMDSISKQEIIQPIIVLRSLNVKGSEISCALQLMISDIASKKVSNLDELDQMLTESFFREHGVVDDDQIRMVFRLRIYKCFENILSGGE